MLLFHFITQFYISSKSIAYIWQAGSLFYSVLVFMKISVIVILNDIVIFSIIRFVIALSKCEFDVPM